MMIDKTRLTEFGRRYYFKGLLTRLLFAGLTVVGLSVALQQFYIITFHTVTRYSLWWHVPFNLFYFWYWLLVFPFIYWATKEFTTSGPKWVYWAMIYFVFPVLLVLVHQLVASIVINLSLGYLNLPTLVYKRIIRNQWLGLDFIIYFAIMIAVNVFEYRRKNRDDQLRLTQLRGQLVRSQLKALESQLHPHFLFNTLNTVSTLILKKENAEAVRMLSLLRDFLNTTIYGSERHVISLSEELKFINQYLEIEKVRFSDRLEVVEDIEDGTLDASVPNFLLQPIVENAIRHAIAPRKSAGRISIRAARQNGRLKLTVEDNGPGLKAAARGKSREGVGLRITAERLVRMFHENQRLSLTSLNEGGTSVVIEIPFLDNALTNGVSTDAA